MKSENTTPQDRSAQRWESSELSQPGADPVEVRAHHLLCAMCVRGGCDDPPDGLDAIQPLLDAMWEYPYVSLKITADLDCNRAHYFDVYEDRDGELPADFEQRQADYQGRRRDLEVCRLMGIAPGTILPAMQAYQTIFEAIDSVEGICTSSNPDSDVWPECPHAHDGCFDRIRHHEKYSAAEQAKRGEEMDGVGIWAMLRHRTREDMQEAKEETVRMIEEADRLYIRPQHVLCILCTAHRDEPLVQDNLIELRWKMEEDPTIPVTLTEGCCMVCDPCNVYHPGEHLCLYHHIKDQLRDLDILEALDLPPGATVPAGELYQRVYDRIESLTQICGWGDEKKTAQFWAPCSGYAKDLLERCRENGVLTGQNDL
ncbi:MAG: hypothetical protein R6V19_11015 [Armatimonadota bacterium]